MKRNGWDKMREERLASEKTKERNAKAREWKKEIYRLRKEYGLCVRCGHNDAQDGTVMCRECRLERSQLFTDNLAKKDRPSGSAEKMAALRRERIANGCCPKCGAKKPKDIYVNCEKCRKKATAYKNKSRRCLA